jgi:hypothetical protein
MIELHVGRWEDVLLDFGFPIECDALIVDPPYGERAHSGSKTTRADGASVDGISANYPPWTHDDVAAFVDAWSPSVRGWMVALTSHDLIPAWEVAYARASRYFFAPIPCVMRGMSVRMRGDGPSSWSVFAMVARPRSREMASWGTLPGAYVGPASRDAGNGRGKPLWLMAELVRDYSREGNLVIDPMCGWGSTLIAAESLGRDSIGADNYEPAIVKARERVQSGERYEAAA